MSDIRKSNEGMVYHSPFTGKKYLVREAKFSQGFVTTLDDHRKGVINDGFFCTEALALNRLPGVAESFVGSARDAYICRPHVEDDGLPEGFDGWCDHYILGTPAQKVRDRFDQNKSLQNQFLYMLAPSESGTLAYRKLVNQQRAATKKELKSVSKTVFVSKSPEERRANKTKKLLLSSSKVKEALESPPKKKRRSRIDMLGVGRRVRPPLRPLT